MRQTTYRYLENRIRVGPLGLSQWAQLVVALTVLYGAVRLFGLPIRAAIPIGTFFIVLPTALAAVSDDFDFSLSGRLRDGLAWIFAPRYYTASDATSAAPVKRAGALRDLNDVAAISPDGLLLRRNGTLVRALEVGSFNPLVADDDEALQISVMLRNIASQLEDGQSLQVLVDGRPLALGAVIDEGRLATQAAIVDCEAVGEHDRAAALARLTTTAEQSITQHSANHAAMTLRYYILIPVDPLVNTFTRALPLTRQRTVQLRDEAYEFAIQQLSYMTETITNSLESKKVGGRLLPGDEFAALIASQASDVPQSPHQFVGLLRPLITLEDINIALELPDPELTDALLPTDIDLRDRARLRVGSMHVQTTFLSSIPETTYFGQPLRLMQIPQRFTYCTHIVGTDRVRERRRYKMRFQRLRGLNTGRMQRGRHVSIEAENQEAEARDVLADLSSTIGTGVFEVSTYITIWVPDGPKATTTLKRHIKTLRREATASDDANYGEGPFAQKALFQSTLPLGNDVAARQKRFVARNVGDLVPLVGSSCGSPSGIVIGHAQPSRSLERIDPFDDIHPNHLMLVSGRSGSGKTLCVIVMISRWLARGARGFLVDRAGHYNFLASLIPGAATLEIGPGDHQFGINPWDVDDPYEVPTEKISFLLDLHSLLIGDSVAGGAGHLDPLEISLLETSIRSVYTQAAELGQAPTESQLRSVLLETAETGDELIAGVARSLAYRLDQFVGDGSYAYLLDRPTNVADDAPLTIFDTKAIPEAKLSAAMLLISEFVMRHIQARREQFLRGDGGTSEWAGFSFLVCDETWALFSSQIAGAWFNELARRGRHLALAFIAISQQISDFDSEHGQAFRRQSTIQIYFSQSAEDIQSAVDTQKFRPAEVELLEGLSTVKRDHSTAFLVNGKRGSGLIRMAYGPLEYWIATSDPRRDEPVRRQALRAADENPWRALSLLADDQWRAAAEDEIFSRS